MLRVARRRALSAAILQRVSIEQLYLPWLCPANLSRSNRHRWVSTDATPPRAELRRRRNSNDASNPVSRRSMATAVHSPLLNDIPFEGGFHVPPAPPLPQRDSDRRNWIGVNGYGLGLDFSNLPPSAAPNYTKNAVRQSKIGVAGSISEVLSVYHACLQVGKIERAGVILQRIALKFTSDVDGLVALHCQYLRASVEQILISPSEAARQAIHKWFELQIRRQGIPCNAEMVAYMLKASLHSPDESTGGNRQRLVKRYMDMMRGEAGLEVLDEQEILTGAELHHITHICPTYNLPAQSQDFSPEIDEIGTFQVLETQQTPLAAVRPVDQKGLGLKSLKKALSLFSHNFDLNGKTAEEKRRIQAKLEEDAVSSAIERWRDESVAIRKLGLDSALQTKSLGARMWKWQVALEQYLKEEIIKVNESELKEQKGVDDAERCLHGPFLRILSPEKLAAITILTTMSALTTQGADKGLIISNMILSIAGAVEDESVFEAIAQHNRKGVWLEKNSKPINVEHIKKFSQTRGPGSAVKMVNGLEKLGFSSEGERSFSWKQWPMKIRAKVGAFLMSALIESTRIPVTLEHSATKQLVTQLQPAFSHAFQYKMGKRYGVIFANKALVESLKREPVACLLAKHLPMLVEPDPWTCFNKGGFLVHPSKLMRVKTGNPDQRFYAEAAIGHGDMVDLCKGLDVLGKTPWRINQPVFEVMLEAWNSGEAIGNISPEDPNLVVPPAPDATQDPLERRRWLRTVRGVENQRTGFHSQRCFQNFQLEIALALRNETFYFPHNVDFRGRAYPIPPYLNHMGADHCRGLLMFGKGRELGENGLKWLKIHLANVFGFDKASLTEREEFASNHMTEIMESATNPLNGTRWWLTAEDPWQFLAACMELKNALATPDLTKFISHLPIHQDGTCNGLQHYAALGGDRWGAQQVNLEPGDRPADVYSAVADLVRDSIAQDMLKGNPFAKILEGNITRKTVKQTVMTNVYGVTFIGARDQVKKQLMAANLSLPSGSSVNYLLLASYIAQKIFDALSSMFRGAHDIQTWFGECAGRISTCLTPEQLSRMEAQFVDNHSTLPKDAVGSKKRAADLQRLEELSQFRTTVIWTTPLNMPVVQPYRNSKSKGVSTTLQRIALSQPHRSDPVNKRKQLQGFPPNFVHSLDAAHMILSALKCDNAGLSFAAVHDSFWTHAADVETMNAALRDSFIKIHSEDVIGRLRAEFCVRYRDCIYLTHVRKSSPLGKRIVQWRNSQPKLKSYLPNSTKGAPYINELLLERKRLKLLSSTNPQDVQEAKEMITPATMFTEMSAEDDLASEPGLAAIVRGQISKRASKSASKNSDENLDSEVNEEFEESEEDEEISELPEEGLSSFEKMQFAKGPKAKVDVKIPIWLPLEFPAVPVKGDFDVSRLKDSQYFFS